MHLPAASQPASTMGRSVRNFEGRQVGRWTGLNNGRSVGVRVRSDHCGGGGRRQTDCVTVSRGRPAGRRAKWANSLQLPTKSGSEHALYTFKECIGIKIPLAIKLMACSLYSFLPNYDGPRPMMSLLSGYISRPAGRLARAFMLEVQRGSA